MSTIPPDVAKKVEAAIKDKYSVPAHPAASGIAARRPLRHGRGGGELARAQ